MRVVEVAEASAPLDSRLRLASWGLYGASLVALALALVGDAPSDATGWGYGVAVLGVCCLWAGNVVAALGRWRSTFIYLGFHLAIALFLLANPVITTLAGIPFASQVERVGAPRALWLLTLSLVAIRIGAAVIEYYYRSTKVSGGTLPDPPHPLVQRILLVATLVTLGLGFVSSLGAWLFVRSHSYAEYYTSYSSQLPAVLEVLGATAAGMVACYLAQFPRDRSHLVVLGALAVTTLPQLAMGLRSPFIAAVVLAGAYVLLRWRLLGGVRARVPVAVLVAAAVAVPVGMAALGALNYARFDKASTNGLDPVTDFVYSQSVSYSVVSRGLELYQHLPEHSSKHYFLGSLTDYVMYGKPAQLLVGAQPLGGNTVRHATEGHEFSHAFSYFLYHEGYLQGRGAGSSYLVETYIDGGAALVFAFSLVIGALLTFLSLGYTRSWLRAAVMLAILPSVFLIPRSNATGFLLPLLLPHFWLAVGFTLAVRWGAPQVAAGRGASSTGRHGAPRAGRRARRSPRPPSPLPESRRARGRIGADR